jgi:hypothetical protein
MSQSNFRFSGGTEQREVPTAATCALYKHNGAERRTCIASQEWFTSSR